MMMAAPSAGVWRMDSTKGKAVHSRHVHVGEDQQIRVPSLQRGCKCARASWPSGDDARSHLPMIHHAFEDPAVRAIVIHHKHLDAV